jgi:hypothetical protein
MFENAAVFECHSFDISDMLILDLHENDVLYS